MASADWPAQTLDSSVIDAYFGGRTELYERVLLQFARSYRDGLPGLTPHELEASRADARRQAHSLKSASAAIGAALLSSQAAAFERMAADGSIEALAAQAVELRDELARVVSVIDARGGAAPAQPQTQDASRLDGELDTLEGLIEQANFAALAHCRRLQRPMQAHLGRDSARVDRLLQQFDFQQALQMLRRLRSAQRERHDIGA